MSTIIDINDDFIIQPYLNVAMLNKPVKDDHLDSKKNLSIKDLLKLPFNVYFQVPGFDCLLNCNEQVLITHNGPSFGYTSPRELIGVPADKYAKRSYINHVKHNDHSVIKANQLTIFQETVELHDNESTYDLITFKFPCYWNSRKAPIIFGISILLDNEHFPASASLADGLTILLKSGLLTQYPLINQAFEKYKIDGVYITNQQLKCLQLAARGLSAKQIAKRINISYRTVEKHIESVKHKLKIKSKSELIEKFINYRQ